MNGKPTLTGRPDVHFNVAHSGGIAMVAVASASVGIDIEGIDARVDTRGVAETVFSPAEIALLDRTPEPERRAVFFSIWTRKEAYLKATGRGFSADLPAISTASTDGAIEDRGDAPSDRTWRVLDLPAPAGFKAALATTGDDCRISIMDIADSLPVDPERAVCLGPAAVS